MNAQEIEQSILDRPLPALLPADQGWVMPHYGGLSIANVPATVAALLGSELPGALPPLPREIWADWAPGLRRVVLVVLDALGYRMLQRMWGEGEGGAFSRLAEAGRLTPLTSVFPSTTDAALISLGSGRPPAEHGWLAYFMYLREMGVAANAILLSPAWSRQQDSLVDAGLDVDELVTVPTLAQHLAEAGVPTHATLSAFFSESAFTGLLYRGVAQIHTHRYASDFWGQLRQALAETRGQRCFHTAYWSGLDTLAHDHGPDADLWAGEFRTVNYLLQHEFLTRLPAEDRDGTLLLITADHGQIGIPPEQILTVTEHAELGRHLLVPVMGESRAAFVYARPGRREAIRNYLEEHAPGWFVVVDSAEALDAGLMGRPVADESYARAGELLVLPTGNHALQQAEPPTRLLGRHGGLTPDEMLVPLIGARLDDQ